MYTMGIIGLGKMGMFHANWITHHEGLRLVAICEKNASRIDELKSTYKVPCYSDVDEFLRSEKMDFVVIVTTNEMHETLSIKALESKRHVIVEKPMSMSHASTVRMIEAAERNKRHIFVHHSSRWDRDYLFVKNTLSSGKLGRILCIQSKVMLSDIGWPSWGIDGMKNPWRVKAHYGGGILFDWGPHLVDQLLQIMGRNPIGVYGILQNGVWSKEVDDYFFSVLKFDDDTVCQIEVSNNSRLDLPRWFIIGTKGTLSVKGRSEPVWSEAEVMLEDDAGEKELMKLEMKGAGESGMGGGFYRDLIPFMEGKKKEFVSMHEASNVVRILELIKQSSAEGRYLSA